MDITSQLFVSDRAATQAEVERAESMLKRDGLIPVEDRSGHRAALELWHRHCRPPPSKFKSLIKDLWKDVSERL